ncbi:unnamed protein product [Lactuca saligna]|uniref:Replication factor A C-terminal domain-containing protein n=1 Tax=Lactuca saligna TaxID=75948 RepID=A0AA35YEB2_LACSI|nr:unnamed protein product [Lactuca saligna]
MVTSLDMILIDQEGSRIQATIKKNLIPVFESLFDEGAVREIIDPYHFISFPDLLARNFDTRVAFDFLGFKWYENCSRFVGSFAMKLNTYISQHNNDTAPVIILLRLAKLKIWGGQPQVGNCLFGSRLHINDDMPQILEFKSKINALDTNVESSSRTSQLNSDTVVANPEDYYLRFQIKNIDEIPDFNEEVGLTIIATIIGFDMDDGWYSFYCRDCSKKVTKNHDDVDVGPFHCDGCGFVSDVFGKIRIVVRVQDESGSSSFVLFERHVKDLIHRGNQWLMDKIAKDQGRQQIPDEFKILLNKNDMLTEKVDYDYYNIELFSSTTWQWREFQNIQLPSSVYPVSDEAVTSGGALYFLLSNDSILRFDIYSEEHILIFSPSTINELKPYASRLINFQGKLGYLSISGDTSWAIWIFIHNRWVKVDDSTYNESAHEWWNYRNNTLYFFRGNTIEYEVPAHHSQQVFSIRSDFDTVTMPGRYY